jgi:hypothetical protein
MSARPESQRGNALIFVVTIGLVITITFALFMSSSVVVEERAVETELAKSRVYWAEMGDFNYALSRISYSGLCNSLLCLGAYKDTDRAPILQAYFNELNNNKTWSYADESSNYNFQTAITAAPDNTAGRQNYSGWLMAASSYTPSTLLSASSGKLPLMELRLCVGLNNNGKCGNITSNNGGGATAYFSVNRLTNLPSP